MPATAQDTNVEQTTTKDFGVDANTSGKVKKAKKKAAKKETNKIIRTQVRNALNPSMGDTLAGEEVIGIIAKATNDFIKRLVQNIVEDKDKSTRQKQSILMEDIERAAQRTPQNLPLYILDGFEPKPRKPRTKKAKNMEVDSSAKVTA